MTEPFPTETAADVLLRERPWARGAVALRVGALLALLLAGLATWPAGAPPTPFLVIGLGALGALAALRPGSPAGAFAFLLVLWWWAAADVPRWHWAALVAVAMLVAAHVLLTVAALTPRTVGPQREVLLLWAWRGAMLSAAGAVVLAVSWLLRASEVGVVAGLVGLLVVVAAGFVLLLRLPEA